MYFALCMHVLLYCMKSVSRQVVELATIHVQNNEEKVTKRGKKNTKGGD